MNILPVVMLALLAAGFWFLVLRPAKARQTAQQKLVNEITVGQRVMTTAGMFGYVRSISDDEIGLEISDGVVVQMLKPAIAKTAELQTPDAPDETTSIDADQVVALDSANADVIDVSKSK